MWLLSVEFEMERELLHMVVGECEIRGKVGNTMRVCVPSHVWYVGDLQVCVGVSVFLSACEKLKKMINSYFFQVEEVNRVFK